MFSIRFCLSLKGFLVVALCALPFSAAAQSADDVKIQRAKEKIERMQDKLEATRLQEAEVDSLMLQAAAKIAAAEDTLKVLGELEESMKRDHFYMTRRTHKQARRASDEVLDSLRVDYRESERELDLMGRDLERRYRAAQRLYEQGKKEQERAKKRQARVRASIKAAERDVQSAERDLVKVEADVLRKQQEREKREAEREARAQAREARQQERQEQRDNR